MWSAQAIYLACYETGRIVNGIVAHLAMLLVVLKVSLERQHTLQKCSL